MSGGVPRAFLECHSCVPRVTALLKSAHVTRVGAQNAHSYAEERPVQAVLAVLAVPSVLAQIAVQPDPADRKKNSSNTGHTSGPL